MQGERRHGRTRQHLGGTLFERDDHNDRLHPLFGGVSTAGSGEGGLPELGFGSKLELLLPKKFSPLRDEERKFSLKRAFYPKKWRFSLEKVGI